MSPATTSVSLVGTPTVVCLNVPSTTTILTPTTVTETTTPTIILAAPPPAPSVPCRQGSRSLAGGRRGFGGWASHPGRTSIGGWSTVDTPCASPGRMVLMPRGGLGGGLRGCWYAGWEGVHNVFCFFIILLFCRDQRRHEFLSFVWWALPLGIVLVTMKSSINTPL